jgi:hypothetical protein
MKPIIALKTYLACLFGIFCMAYSPLALAYIGPGLGTGAVAAVLGTFFGLLMLIVGVVWYPIKRLLKRFWPKK